MLEEQYLLQETHEVQEEDLFGVAGHDTDDDEELADHQMAVGRQVLDALS